MTQKSTKIPILVQGRFFVLDRSLLMDGPLPESSQGIVAYLPETDWNEVGVFAQLW